MSTESNVGSQEVLEIVRSKARAIARRSGPQTESNDVEQALFEKLLRAERSYDPARGSFPAFARRVIETYAKTIAAGCGAQRAKSRRTVSLHTTFQLDDGAVIELAQLVSSSNARRHRAYF